CPVRRLILFRAKSPSLMTIIFVDKLFSRNLSLSTALGKNLFLYNDVKFPSNKYATAIFPGVNSEASLLLKTDLTPTFTGAAIVLEYGEVNISGVFATPGDFTVSIVLMKRVITASKFRVIG